MKHVAILCTVLLVAVFAMGCNDQNTPTALSNDTSAVLFKISNAPANSGPIVARDQGDFFAVFYVDTKAGISAIHGLDVVDFCTPPIGTTSEPPLMLSTRCVRPARFLSQGDEKTARFDFDRSTSEQRSVNEIMVNLVHKIERRVKKYAQA